MTDEERFQQAQNLVDNQDFALADDPSEPRDRPNTQGTQGGFAFENDRTGGGSIDYGGQSPAPGPSAQPASYNMEDWQAVGPRPAAPISREMHIANEVAAGRAYRDANGNMHLVETTSNRRPDDVHAALFGPPPSPVQIAQAQAQARGINLDAAGAQLMLLQRQAAGMIPSAADRQYDQGLQQASATVRQQLNTGEIDEQLAGRLQEMIAMRRRPLLDQQTWLPIITAEINNLQHMRQSAHIANIEAQNARFLSSEMTPVTMNLADGSTVYGTRDRNGTFHQMVTPRQAARDEYTRAIGPIRDRMIAAVQHDVEHAARPRPAGAPAAQPGEMIPHWFLPLMAAGPRQEAWDRPGMRTQAMQREVASRTQRELEERGLRPAGDGTPPGFYAPSDRGRGFMGGMVDAAGQVQAPPAQVLASRNQDRAVLRQARLPYQELQQREQQLSEFEQLADQAGGAQRLPREVLETYAPLLRQLQALRRAAPRPPAPTAAELRRRVAESSNPQNQSFDPIGG